jgi:predicted nucleic acid-binding Zn ribbon protein
VPPQKLQVPYRVCKNCPTKFPAIPDSKVFCSGNCRKDYSRKGGPNFARVRELLRKDLRGLVQEEVERALEERARATA